MKNSDVSDKRMNQSANQFIQNDESNDFYQEE